MRRRAWIISAVLCTAILATGCSSREKENFNVDTGYDNSEAESNAGNNAEKENVADEGKGRIAQQLGIPESAQMELPVEGTKLKKIEINDPDITVPEKDRMYTKSYRMGILNEATKEEIVKTFVDEDSGIYNYPEEMFNANDVDREAVESIFEDKDSTPDYSGTYFIGKMNGEPYVVRFMEQEWSADEAFAVSRVYPDEIPEDMAARQAVKVTYYDYNPDELYEDVEENDEESSEDDTSTDKADDNASGMNLEQASVKASEYMNSWGIKDVIQTSVNDMYRAYEGSGYNIIQYEKDGYTVRFDASINDVSLYQPMATSIDTITLQSSQPEDYFNASSLYYAEVSYYNMSFNEDGLKDLYGYWPMRSEDELHQVDRLITWDEAIESLKKVIPDHFADYTGYSEVNFNDVRLTYFRTKTGDGEYEVIPVYVFSQVESWGVDSPIQLIMLDARDGSEVNVVQDPDRMGLIG